MAGLLYKSTIYRLWTLLTDNVFIIILVTVIAFFILLFSSKKEKSYTKKRVLILLLFSFYISFLLTATLLGRGIREDAADKILSGWKVYRTKRRLYIDPIINVLMFIPLGYGFYYTFFPQKKYNLKAIVTRAGFLGAVCSLTIEMSQLIFSKGTFQISDLVYNTISCIIGAFLWWFRKSKDIKS